MLTWLSMVVLALSLGAALTGVIHFFRNQPLQTYQLVLAGALELASLVQLIVAVVFLATGGAPAGLQTVMFVIYLIIAVLLPPIGVFWALLDRTKFSSAIYAITALVQCVLFIRLIEMWN